MSNEKLQANKELGFLYKKCSIRPYVISQMALVPEYVEAIKAYKGEINKRTTLAKNYLLKKEGLRYQKFPQYLDESDEYYTIFNHFVDEYISEHQ